MTAVTGGALLAACGPSGGADTGAGDSMADDTAMEEAITIRFMSWADIFGEVLDLYNESHETQVEMSVSPWSGYSEKMLTQFAGGTVPEIMWVQSMFFPMLVQRNVFAEIDGLVERDGVDVDGLVGSPWVWVGWQGKAYGIPAHGAVPRGWGTISGCSRRPVWSCRGMTIGTWTRWTRRRKRSPTRRKSGVRQLRRA